MATQTRPQMVDEPGVWFGIATGLLVSTFLVTAVLHVGTTDTALAAILVGGLAAARLRLRWCLAIGAIAWAFFTGFSEHAFGQLTVAPGDLARLAGFVAATTVLAYGVRSALGAAVAEEGRDG